MVAQVVRQYFNENALKSDNLYYLYYRWRRIKQDTSRPFVPMRIRTLVLENKCPLHISGNDEAGIFISAYLVRLINEQKTEGASCVLLPTVNRLSEFFGVTEASAKDAYERLGKNGYQLNMPHSTDESPVLVLHNN